MKYAYTYLAICLLPIFVNYEQPMELPMEFKSNHPVFWCECGVKEHWKTRPLKRLN